MPKAKYAFWAVQAFSITRVVTATAFVTVAFQSRFHTLAVLLYATAAVTDVLDGWTARAFRIESRIGAIFDLVGDKYLTVTSCLYAAMRGVAVIPLALIILREVVSLAARGIQSGGQYALPPNRVFGGLMAIAIWGTTLILVVRDEGVGLQGYGVAYTIFAVLSLSNIAVRAYRARDRIRAVGPGF